jgi:hypothetical protein
MFGSELKVPLNKNVQRVPDSTQVCYSCDSRSRTLVSVMSYRISQVSSSRGLLSYDAV